MDLLRFLTAGSVDDGKSTLIGRLLYDSKSILIDHLEAIKQQSKNKEDGEFDLALLTDGLRAEREQGITIDVAYKYFSTPERKFIIADVPGHIQYTRNMVTGASNSDLMIILIDARKGVIEQTRRHALIASILNIPQVLVAINKMDLVDFDESIFYRISQDFKNLAERLHFRGLNFIPISALNGDNVVSQSQNMTWYKGPCLLEFLERVDINKEGGINKPRFSVQYVIRPQTKENLDYRGYAGKIISGSYKVGDDVVVLPNERITRIKRIEKAGKEVNAAEAPESVVLLLEEDLDISRGDMICVQGSEPVLRNRFGGLVCWMDEKPLKPGNRYWLQVNSLRVKAKILAIQYKIDIHSYDKLKDSENAGLNDIVFIEFTTGTALGLDSFEEIHVNGQGILIDENTYSTVGAFIYSNN